jgi:hypothetical protein
MNVIAFKQAAPTAIEQQEEFRLDARTLNPSALKKKYKLTYDSWRNVKDRCRDMGIVLDQRFANFPDFLYHLGPRTDKRYTCDRFPEREGPYSPENCRWADRQQQAYNRKNTVKLTYNGETAPLTVWAKKLGVSSYTLRARRRLRWTDEEIVTGKRGAAKAVTGPLPWPTGKEQDWESLFAEKANEKESREHFLVRVCQRIVCDLNIELLRYTGGHYEDGEFIDPTPPPAELVARLERAQRALADAQQKIDKAIEQAKPKLRRFDDLFPQ